MATVRDIVLDIVDWDHEHYDQDRWPTWREWVDGARAIDSRHTALQRLRLLSVLGEGDQT